MATKKLPTKKKSGMDELVEEVREEREEASRQNVKAIDSDGYPFLAGYKDENGTRHKDFAVREMNGDDEEYFGKQQNVRPEKMTTKIIERMCTRIGTIEKSKVGTQKWHDIIENLYVADQDAIMLVIRETSLGDELEIQHKCPECGKRITTKMTFDEFETIPWDGEDGIQFELPVGYKDDDGVHKDGILLYPRGIDREVALPFAAKNNGRGKTIMLSRLMKFNDGTEVTEATLRKMSVRDRNYLMELFNTRQFGIDLEIEIECPDCGNVFNATVSAGGFF